MEFGAFWNILFPYIFCILWIFPVPISISFKRLVLNSCMLYFAFPWETATMLWTNLLSLMNSITKFTWEVHIILLIKQSTNPLWLTQVHYQAYKFLNRFFFWTCSTGVPSWLIYFISWDFDRNSWGSFQQFEPPYIYTAHLDSERDAVAEQIVCCVCVPTVLHIDFILTRLLDYNALCWFFS